MTDSCLCVESRLIYCRSLLEATGTMTLGSEVLEIGRRGRASDVWGQADRAEQRQ